MGNLWQRKNASQLLLRSFEESPKNFMGIFYLRLKTFKNNKILNGKLVQIIT